MRILLFFALMWAGMVQAQEMISANNGQLYYGPPNPDTVPVWVIYMDSVRMYASYPDFDMRLKVAPGWRINLDAENSIWVDQEGHRFNADNVILDKPRKPRPNPFKE